MEKAKCRSVSRQIVKDVDHIQVTDGQYEQLVSWERRHDEEGSISEPFTSLKHDIPCMVKDYLHTSEKQNLKSRFLIYFCNDILSYNFMEPYSPELVQSVQLRKL